VGFDCSVAKTLRPTTRLRSEKGSRCDNVYASMQTQLKSGEDRYTVINRKQAWLLTFVGFTALGFLNFEYRYLDDLARDRAHTFGIHLFEEMTGAYVALLLFPLFLWLVRRTRIHRDNWWRMVPLNLLIFVAISICDTTMMGLSRSLLAPAFGLGAYDYGNMLYRYPMEFAQHLVLFSVAVSIIYFVDSYRDARNRQLATADLEARLAEAQLQNLRLQLQPHFLFNALNTISSVMHEDVYRADTMLAQLSDLLRRTLHLGHSQVIPLKDELSLLKLYLSIMEERFGEDLHVEFDVDPALSEALVPQLILQPLVENSIRYARGAHASQLDIHILAIHDQSDLMLRVRDNGPGIPNLEDGHWRKGIGLSNTEQRLAGLYGESQRMFLENADGLTITIRVPLKTEATAR
jgi:two-component system LytT family sensor kinase